MSLGEITIDARGVTKVYGSGALAYQALRGVDFSAREGEMVMLNGPSGSGKTTLLSILGCVLTPTGGSVKIFGHELMGVPQRKLPELRLAYIGFIFQGHNLLASLEARENVALPLRMRGWGARDAMKEADRLLERVGLADKTERRQDELSGGQKQRVAIARALAGNPPILLADEPTASLDAETGLAVTQLLKDLASADGHTAVVVTHDNRIFHLADRIVNIEDGHIVPSVAGHGATHRETAHAEDRS